MSDSKRVLRVERELREIIASYLISGIKQKPPGFVTVSRVWIANDLQIARVYITAMGEGIDPEACADFLNDRKGEVQQHIGRQLRMKFCPKIEFYFDKSLEKSLQVQSVLKSIETPKGSEDS